jgi:uncharacterized protein YjiS (DUF1127 family)
LSSSRYVRRHADVSAVTVTFIATCPQVAGMAKAWQAVAVECIRANLTNANLWLRRSRTRGRLHELDARALADVGLTECRRRRECAKWFWQA